MNDPNLTLIFLSSPILPKPETNFPKIRKIDSLLSCFSKFLLPFGAGDAFVRRGSGTFFCGTPFALYPVKGRTRG
jgi:hypothetical protein